MSAQETEKSKLSMRSISREAEEQRKDYVYFRVMDRKAEAQAIELIMKGVEGGVMI
jgi:hypothetical protein